MGTRSLLAATAAGTLVLGMALHALPASAATSGGTLATFSVTAGTLSITVSGTASLGSRVNSVAGGPVSGTLGQVQVLDGRTAAAGSTWIATVISSSFVPTPAGTAIAASAIGYTAGSITQVGTATYTAGDPPDMTAVHAAISATGITGDNSATWNPTITVMVPGGALVASYVATITHSVA